MSRVLVVNSGSSSLKYQLIEMTGESTIARGLIERIGEGGSASEFPLPEGSRSDRLEGESASGRALKEAGSNRFEGGSASDGGLGLPPMEARRTRSPIPPSEASVTVPDHTAAFRIMLDGLREQGIDPADPIAAIGHRVVHGGERFVQPTIVTAEVKKTIEELSVLAPLHNPPNLAGIAAAEHTFPGVPQVAVFDTAFHQTLPPAAYTYAIDRNLSREEGIRRFGFHGISFQYVSAAAADFLGRPLNELKLIVLHLGNGASACAIDGGKSVETSMGMTPLEGLVMGTRGGDIDPGVLLHLEREAGLSVDDLDDLLNHHSGLLGLGGFNDVRDVQAAAASGDTDAQLAFDVYVHRLRSYVGSYLAQLGGADAIVFTAGVGENNAAVRAGALQGLERFGIRIDARRNQFISHEARRVSDDDSHLAVLVIPTNEEIQIARQAFVAVQAM